MDGLAGIVHENRATRLGHLHVFAGFFHLDEPTSSESRKPSSAARIAGMLGWIGRAASTRAHSGASCTATGASITTSFYSTMARNGTARTP